MNLEEVNQPSLERKEKINEKAKTIEELASFSVKYNNPFYFEDFGLDNESELIKNTKVKKEVLENLNEEDKEWVEFILESFKSFLKGPIFTDSFHKNHRDLFNEDNFTRYKWQIAHREELSEKALQYYNANRLRINKCSNIVGFLPTLKDLVVNPDIKNKLLDFEKSIPSELLDKDEEEVLQYSTLEDDEKIRVVKELTKIVEKTILLLTEKQI